MSDEDRSQNFVGKKKGNNKDMLFPKVESSGEESNLYEHFEAIVNFEKDLKNKV